MTEFIKLRRNEPWSNLLVGVVVLALVLRCAFVLAYEQFPPFLGDDFGYDNVAVNLVEGKGFLQTTAHPILGNTTEPLVAFGPIYPSFLAFLYFFFGHSITAVRITQGLLGAITVLLVFRIACAIFEERIAIIAAALTAIHPALIIYTGMILTETLFAFLLVLSVWALIVAVQVPSSYAWLRAGFALGLTILLRAENLVVAFLFVVAVLWFCGHRQARHLLVLTLALVLTVGAWTIRNVVVFKEPILVSANGGKTLWISTVGWDEWRDEEPLKSLVRGLNTLDQNRILGREGMRNIFKDPGNYLRLCFERIPAFWLGSYTTYLVGFSDSFHAYFERRALGKVFVKGIFLCINFSLLGFAFWGIWRVVFKENRQLCLRALILCPIVAIAAVHFFLFATSRYQVPILPFILMFSAAGVQQVLSHFPSWGRLLVLGGPRR